MDDVQHVTIPCDLLLVSVPGGGFFLHKLLYAGAGGHNALNGVRGFRALYLGDLNQLFQFIRTLLQIQFLLASFLVYGSNQTKDIGIPFLIAE